ncbi:hypothetical protein KO481_38215 [Nocardia sp. NEAU-G5]|uniref:DNA-binding domain-containing protein n=2 Tax=Nocardia albiluteola TaxID=2842303 RepID=A0ABS6BAN7_9NOCA|nr:hypothetical protein [Nocardia albiluteola]
MFGVSSRSVGTWWRRYRGSGRESLAAPVKSRTGREKMIGAQERGVLFGAMADYTPDRAPRQRIGEIRQRHVRVAETLAWMRCPGEWLAGASHAVSARTMRRLPEQGGVTGAGRSGRGS